MNVILLAMSTFPREMRLNTAKNETEKYSYFSQLEAGCKHFIKTLADRNEKVDKIISICTEETLVPVSKKLYYNDAEIDMNDKSPYSFFKERMEGFIRNDESALRYEKELCFDVSDVTAFLNNELYKDTELDSIFETAKTDSKEKDFTDTLRQVIGIIDDAAKDPNIITKKIQLYLNAQGGSRTNIQIINTVLSMLKTRKYTLEEVSVIEYNSDSKEQYLSDVTESYLKNDLAAALDSFLQYGRSDMFVEYYKRYKKTRNISEAPEDDIVAAINRISDYILLCDPDGFLKGLQDLKRAIEIYEDEHENTDKYFKLIIDDIKNSYGNLLSSKYIVDDLDVLVEWCLDKKLYQQALTLLEAKAPEFLVRNGVMYYDKTAVNAFRAISNESTNNNYYFDDLCHYFFVYLTDRNVNIDDDGNYTCNLAQDPYKKYIKNNRLCVYFNTHNIHVKSDLISQSIRFIGNCNGHTDIAHKLLCDIMIEYSKMRKLRNNINHSNSSINQNDEVVSIDELKEDLLNKINEFNELLKKVKNKINPKINVINTL